MSWNEEKVEKLKELWGSSGKTASQIAEIIGGVSRNAVIGKAHRLNLSAKIKARNVPKNKTSKWSSASSSQINNRSKRNRFRSLLLDKNFEQAKNLTLEELTEHTCKYMDGHPNETNARFCGRKTVEKFSYCPLHLMIIFQPKGKKDDIIEKDDDIPKFIEKKIKSA